MKTILLYSTFIMLVVTSSFGQAQNITSEKQIKILKEFYTKYNAIWSTYTKTTPYDILVDKSDSLIAIYCTPKLREKAKEWFGGDGGHNLLTNDFFGEMVQKTLSVRKNPTKSNGYVVSYTAHDTDPYGNNYNYQVTLYVTLVKTGKSYKIDSVK